MPPKKRPPDRSNAGAQEPTAKRPTRSDAPAERKRPPVTSNSREPNPPPSTSSSQIGSSDIIIQLSQNTLKNTKLRNPRILKIPNAIYITEPEGTASDGTTHYLYDLVCRIFECELSHVKLYRQPDGAFRDENGHGWQAVGHHDEVKTGIYLCKVGKGTVSIDPVHIAKGGQGSRPSSQAGTREQTPDQSSMLPSLVSPGKQAVGNVLKAAVKSKTGSSKFRESIAARDRGCIVYGTHPDHCKASHIIPASLVKLKLSTTGPMVLAGGTTVVDEYDPDLGILLGHDLDFHFDRFQMSLYVTENNVRVHLFRTSKYFKSTDFLPSAWNARGKDVNLVDVDNDKLNILRYHYKHSIVEAWGSYELQKLLMPDFPQADELELALLYSLGEDIYPTPPSSSAVKYFFQESC